MKFKDYKRLSKISIKSRKKSTRTTSRGIAFGLTMIIPVLFLGLSLKLDISKTINETKNISTTALVTSSDDTIYSETMDDVVYALPDKSSSDVITSNNKDLIEDSIRFKSLALALEGNPNVTVSINNVEEDISEEFGRVMMGNNLANYVKVLEDGQKLYPKAYNEDLSKNGKSFFAAGSGFSADSKGEILISEEFAKVFAPNVKSLIGKKFDLKISGNGDWNYELDNDNNPNNTTDSKGENFLSAKIFDDFIIKGIISNDYFRLSSLTKLEGSFWITESSFATDDLIAPVLTYNFTQHEGYKEEKMVVTYVEDSMTLEEKAMKNKQMFVAFPLVSYKNPYSYRFNIRITKPVTVTLMQCGNYEETVMLNNSVKGYLKMNYNIDSEIDEDYYVSTFQFKSFTMLNTTSRYLILCLSIFGGIIFFATLLNLYNSVNYSVDSRHNYLAMMRAIGAKNNVIPRLYLMEILLIFTRALPWAIIFSFGLSFGMKMMVDGIFGYGSEMFGTTITLSLNFYFIALVVVLLAIILIGLIFSFIACLPITRKKILDIFDDDK